MWTEPSLIFALTVKFQVEYSGRHWSDSDALFACMKRALDNGIPILDGKFLAQVTRLELERIFSANIELPMLDEKMESWHQVGSVLAEKYNGRFHNFVKSCPLRLYDNGAGLRDRLVKEFPRFNDISQHDGATAKFYNLPQLGIWFVYWALRKSSQFGSRRRFPQTIRLSEHQKYLLLSTGGGTAPDPSVFAVESMRSSLEPTT